VNKHKKTVVIKKVLMKRRNLFKKITSLRIFKNAINTFQELSKKQFLALDRVNQARRQKFLNHAL
jgi:hypothetical protein